jgi:O-antigen/teichoic acid export membrane protein
MIIYPLMVYLFIFSEEFITLIFSSKYSGSAPVFRIYLAALIPNVTWYGALLVALGKSRDVFIASSLSLICNLILNLLLIQGFGFLGPAYATVITAFLVWFYWLFRIRKVLHVGWLDVFPWRKLLFILLSSILLGIIIALLKNASDVSREVSLALGFVLFLIPLTIIYLALGLVSEADIAFVRKFLKIRKTGGK